MAMIPACPLAIGGQAGDGSCYGAYFVFDSIKIRPFKGVQISIK